MDVFSTELGIRLSSALSKLRNFGGSPLGTPLRAAVAVWCWRTKQNSNLPLLASAPTRWARLPSPLTFHHSNAKKIACSVCEIIHSVLHICLRSIHFALSPRFCLAELLDSQAIPSIHVQAGMSV
jgi:hypothetical protein